MTVSVRTLPLPQTSGPVRHPRSFRESPVVLLDDAADVAYLVDSATGLTADRAAFMIRHSSGFLWVAMSAGDCDRLRLPAMPGSEPGSRIPGSTVTVDAADGISTGISAADRAHTIALLGNPTSDHSMLNRPGHVAPIRVDHGDPRSSAAHVCAALTLVNYSGTGSAAALTHLLDERGDVAGRTGASLFAREHGLEIVHLCARQAAAAAARWTSRYVLDPVLGPTALELDELVMDRAV
jgi:3,4-dihydroxy 2-butanone 4-phosphate synthase/GTP cyclohydrolase II